MNCQDCRQKLLDYVGESLEAASRAEVAQHLLGCVECRAELEAIRNAKAQLPHWSDHDAPAGLAARTISALEDDVGDRGLPPPVFGKKSATAARKLFRPVLSPLAACALLACVGYYTQVSSMRVRLGAEAFGGNVLEPGMLSVVRLSLFDVEDHAAIADRPVQVAIRDSKGHETPLFSGRSDARGQVAARLDVPKLPPGDYQLVVHALDGRDATRVALPVKLARSQRLLLSTDKPMYQPGQTIHTRALAFDVASHKPAKDAKVIFSVLDPKGTRIFKVEKKVDAFGVASFDLPLADQLNLGDYKVSAKVGDTQSDATVQVARYALPKFDVQVELDAPWVAAGAAATGRIRAKYFFGKPVANAKVAVEAGVFIDGFRAVAHQDVVTDADGMARFRLDLPPALPGTSLASGNAVLQISADARDAADEQVEKHAELIVAAQPLSVTAIPENGALVPGVANRVLVLVARPDGQPVAKAQVVLGSGAVAQTGDDGVAALELLPEAGRRDVQVRATAPDGTQLSRSIELTGEPSFAVIRTDKSLYAAGETVKGSIIATSALSLAYLDVVSEGRTVMTQVVDLKLGKGEFAFELPPEVTGAVSLEAYARNGGALLRTRRIVYAADPRGLAIDVSVDRETHKPGEPIKLRFHVADEHGKAAVAGLGVSVVDESVFALANKDPAMLRAFLTLAEELRTPKFSLDVGNVIGDRAQSAADLLFSASKLQPTVAELGHTDSQELTLRRAALAAFKDKRTGTAYFAGLFMFGLMLEGVLRLLAERALTFLFRKPLGLLLLAAGVEFVFCDIVVGDRIGGAVRAVMTVVVVGPALVFFKRGWARNTFAAVMVVGLVGLVTIFGDNIRKTFGASVDALAGLTTAATGSGHHRNVEEFDAVHGIADVPARREAQNGAAIGDDGEGAPPAKGAIGFGDLAPRKELDKLEKVLGGDQIHHLRKSRVTTIQGLKGGLGESLDDALPVTPLSDQQKSEVRVRSFFPETLFWAPELVTDAHGDASLELPGADSITTWRAAVTATAADGRLGTGKAALRVFQDFFVDIDMPPLLTVGDQVEIPIAVHSELDAPETVTIEIAPADWLESSAPRDYRLTLKPGEVAGIKYRFTAKRFGASQPLTVYAVGPHGKDAVRREVEVRPAGVAFDSVVNGNAERGATARIELPSDAVPGASHAELRLYPSTFSAVLDGLENVLRMPYGCFEQTSSTTYPNALVMRYLRENKRGSPEIFARAESYLTTGYQRLLSYEVNGGGFEWFGRAPANQVLTAYGLLEFSDMAKVFPVDEQVIARTQRFLVARQSYDGSWPVDTQALADGLYRDVFQGRLTTTAYITWALAESGYRGEATDRAARFLQSRAQDADDAYTRALVANALLELSPQSAGAAVERLVALEAEGPGQSLYFPAGAGTQTVTFAQGNSADVETTALAASALIRVGRGAEAVRALRWLLASRDPHGTWQSTQATVLALRALLQASATAGLGESRGTLKVIGPRGEVALHFTPDQADVVQRVDLTDSLGAGPLEIRFDGDAQASYQLELSGYRRPEAAVRPALALALDYDHPALRVDDTVTARLTATYQRPGASGMVLVEAAIPPGFEAVPDDLQALVDRRQVARFANDGKALTFYVDKLETGKPLALTYRLKAKFPVRAAAPASIAYLYYDPSVRAQSRPLQVTVAAR